jgi:hypothetical protein
MSVPLRVPAPVLGAVLMASVMPHPAAAEKERLLMGLSHVPVAVRAARGVL